MQVRCQPNEWLNQYAHSEITCSIATVIHAHNSLPIVLSVLHCKQCQIVPPINVSPDAPHSQYVYKPHVAKTAQHGGALCHRQDNKQTLRMNSSNTVSPPPYRSPSSTYSSIVVVARFLLSCFFPFFATTSPLQPFP